MLKKILWDGVINYGCKIDAEQWHAGKTWYLSGYSAKRTIKYGDSEFTAFVRIFASTINRPLFECVIRESEETVSRTLATNPTTAAKKALSDANLELNLKNGNSFYGLDRLEVIRHINSLPIPNATNAADCFISEVITHTPRSKGCQIRWRGVISYGEALDEEKYVCRFGSQSFKLQPGYEALRDVTLPDGYDCELHCKLELNENRDILFSCFTTNMEPGNVKCSSHRATEVVKDLFKKLNIDTKKKWSGYDFFGFMKQEVLSNLQQTQLPAIQENAKLKRSDLANHDILKQGMQIRARNAGETSNLMQKRSINQRNEVIHNIVNYVSFGDVKSYLKHICEVYPEIIEQSLDECPDVRQQIRKQLKVSQEPVKFNTRETAEILLGKCNLSQRGYKNLRKILKQNNVILPQYTEVSEYCKDVDVGIVKLIHNKDESSGETSTCKCMGACTNVKDTLQNLVSCAKFYEKLSFYSEEKQIKIFDFLKSKDPSLYANLDSSKRTLFLRETGDNFRAASNYPTEQTSFSVLNLKKLVNCPYGQFISTLWRGSETRNMLITHVKVHYDEMAEAVQKGVDLIVNNSLEHFNVVIFFVADLCFLKDVLGVCSCNGTYGCYHCELPRQSWSARIKAAGKPRNIKKMNEEGEKAKLVLGENPNHDSAIFKKTQLSHHGQYGPSLFTGFITELMPPCGLHLILAHHRYLYKFLYDIINKRGMDFKIPEGLRSIGCGYLAYQIEQYHKSKKKQYDGSGTLKMIGNDCKILEDNIDTFLYTFLTPGQEWESSSNLKLRQIYDLYKTFADLARDIRSTEVDEARVKSFGTRAEIFFKKFLNAAPTTFINGLPYLHYLRDHIGPLMILYADLFDWGYGISSCNAGEHLNKRVKYSELSETNLDSNRFLTVTHMMRLKQFEFTDTIMPDVKPIICSACKQPGHNKKNKSCPMHPSHPPIHFPESEDEFDADDLEN